MTNQLIILGASLLLMVNPNCLAFQQAPPLPQSFSKSCTTVTSFFVSRQTPTHRKRFGSRTIIRASFFAGDDEEEEGYEIGRDASFDRRQSNPLRVGTTFGAENVPVEQRPSNEYLNLIQQPTFAWASQESGDGGLALRLAVTYVVFFVLVCYPISGATWVNEGYSLQKLTASNVGAMSVVFVLVLRLYSGWGYIGSRLQSKVIEYEETGWYDGDFEEKSDAEKARDLFLYRSNVKPVEDRLQRTSLVVGGAWLASCLALNIATSIHPIFNQYDPKLLEKLSYDDKVAEVVQRQSNGRPTYCENRYYRAVANGGQGCN